MNNRGNEPSTLTVPLAEAVQPIIDIRGLRKSYRNGSVTTEVLRDIDLEVRRGEFLAIMGPSGCGKSTLLYVMGLLTHHDGGTLRVAGCDADGLADSERTQLRRNHIGFVFQRFNLLPALSAEANLRISLKLRGGDAADESVLEMLERVSLGDKRHKLPQQLSIGEQQRVAIARSLVGRPALLLADEPTGNLDSENGRKILDLLSEFHQRDGQTIVMVTHSEEAAQWADRVVRMRDGRRVDERA